MGVPAMGLRLTAPIKVREGLPVAPARLAGGGPLSQTAQWKPVLSWICSSLTCRKRVYSDSVMICSFLIYLKVSGSLAISIMAGRSSSVNKLRKVLSVSSILSDGILFSVCIRQLIYGEKSGLPILAANPPALR